MEKDSIRDKVIIVSLTITSFILAGAMAYSEIFT